MIVDRAKPTSGGQRAAAGWHQRYPGKHVAIDCGPATGNRADRGVTGMTPLDDVGRVGSKAIE